MRRTLVMATVGLFALAGCGGPSGDKVVEKGPSEAPETAVQGKSGPPGSRVDPKDPDRSTKPSNPIKPDPTDPTFPPKAGKGRLVAFEQYKSKGNEIKLHAAEVSQPDQTEAFLKPLGLRRSAKIDRARTQGVRLFAFPLVGCRLTGATLHMSAVSLNAKPAGDEKVRCMMAEYYYAVFAVDADDVPPKARIAPLLR